MTARIFDKTNCALGEGPLWHPGRGSLFWFDILGRRMHGEGRVRPFDEHVSAAGWVDHDTLLIASETQLFTYNLETGASEHIVPFDAENPVTRSNDGRADPWGGFWIGTMGKQSEKRAGAIYRFYRGSIERLYDGITVANAICFSPDGKFGYFTDTHTRRIMRQSLGNAGWPVGAAEIFIDTREEGLNPDGAVVDAEGCLWVAQWGAARVARYGPDGSFLGAVAVAARQSSCPAFGGPDLKTLYVTSAAIGLEGPDEGRTFAVETGTRGQREHRVIL